MKHEKKLYVWNAVSDIRYDNYTTNPWKLNSVFEVWSITDFSKLLTRHQKY
jgi:3-methyladenine DNA glycosylase AlkC